MKEILLGLAVVLQPTSAIDEIVVMRNALIIRVCFTLKIGNPVFLLNLQQEFLIQWTLAVNYGNSNSQFICRLACLPGP